MAPPGSPGAALRVWDVSPGYLNRQSLLGEHRELHGLHAILIHGKAGFIDDEPRSVASA
jgi:pyrimidine dimer DNA glycosylase